MTILVHPSFEKSYRQRIARRPPLVRRTADRLKLFEEHPRHPLLKDHALVGQHIGVRAFSVTGDLRIVYKPLGNDRILLLDIGAHNQVY